MSNGYAVHTGGRISLFFNTQQRAGIMYNAEHLKFSIILSPLEGWPAACRPAAALRRGVRRARAGLLAMATAR